MREERTLFLFRMRKLLLLLFVPALVAGLAGCMTSYPPHPRLLTSIPLRPHRNDVRVYLEGEKPLNQNYYEVASLAVPLNYGNLYDKVMALEAQGQQIGVDAILITGSSPDYTSEGDSSGLVHAVGIKYRDRLDYVQEYLKRKDVYAYLPDGSTPLVYQADFDLMGDEGAHLKYRKDTIYHRYVQRYAFDYLMHAIWGWSYRSDAQGNIIQRLKREDGTPAVRCRFEYNPYGNVASIRLITYPNARVMPSTEEWIVLNYNEYQQVTEKLIFDKQKRLKYREAIRYEQSGRVQQSTLYAVRRDGQVPIVTTVHYYYAPGDLPPLAKGL